MCRNLSLKNVSSCLVDGSFYGSLDGNLPSGFGSLTILRSLKTEGSFPHQAYKPFLGLKSLEHLHFQMPYSANFRMQYKDACSLPWQSTKLTCLQISGHWVKDTKYIGQPVSFKSPRCRFNSDCLISMADGAAIA